MPSDKQSHDPNHVVPINGAKFFCEFKLKCADSFESDDGIFSGKINVVVKNNNMLKKLMENLKKINGIDKVQRV